jgi:ABC-type oligopeptide transport system ATPase subunit
MKQVMKKRFVPSSYQRDLRNRLQLLKEGKKSVDEYFKKMELLLVWTGIREDPKSTMARFLGRLNEEISGFVEMFPYHTLQDLVDQAMHTKRKNQQVSRGKSYASHYNIVSWHKQQSIASFGGGWSQGNAARSSPSNGTSKMVASIGSFPANKQRPATSTSDPTEASVAISCTRTREIVCHKCHGRGHIAAQCPSIRTMLLNEKGEWESDSDPEDDEPKFDEEIQQAENEIHPEEGDHNYFISLRVLSVTAEREEKG